ncbi:hypothetical protein WA026_013871 [Henosepilachna vigintioctopunctata]|uniref:Uncharacterized protein n=1 Tax=Henosepilachna vigintioctopunctata TaxID=420089 RepID=A0AAW1U994_9CUCU
MNNNSKLKQHMRRKYKQKGKREGQDKRGMQYRKLIFPIESPVENEERYVVQYAINEANKNVFKERLNAADWSTLLTNRADRSYENFHNKFQKYFIECFPKIRTKHRRNVEIISEETKSLKNLIDAAQIIHKVKKSNESKNLIHCLKSRLRNSYTKHVKILNNKYINNAPNKVRAIWKVINRESGRTSRHDVNSQLEADELNFIFPILD